MTDPSDATVALVPLTADLVDEYARVVRRNEDHLSVPEEERGRRGADHRRSLTGPEQRNTVLAVMADARLVGRVDLVPVDPPRFGLGYWVDGERCGRGIGTRAVGLALAHARAVLDATDVYAGVEPDNAASVRVLERNGFVRVARLDAHDRYHRPLDGGEPRDAP